MGIEERLDVLDVLVDASRELEVHAPSAAGKVLNKLVARFPTAAPERQQLIARSARLHLIAGQFDEVEDMVAGEEFVEVEPTTHDHLQVTLAQLAMCRGDFKRALQLTEPPDGDVGVYAKGATLLALRAHALLQQEGPGDAVGIAALAIEQARAVGDAEAEVLAMTAASECQRRVMDFAGALTWSEEAVQVAAQAGTVHHLHPELWHARALLALDRVAEAENVIFEGQARTAARGTSWATPLWHLGRVEASLATGRFGHGLDEARVGLTHAERHGFTAAISPLHLGIAWAHMGLGDLDEARAALRRAEYSLSEASPALQPAANWTKALLAELRGRRAQATASIAALSTLDAVDAVSGLAGLPHLTIPVARMLRRLGAQPMLVRFLERCEHVAASNPGVMSRRAAAEHVQGIAHGDLAALQRARALYERLGIRWAAAAAEEDVADMANPAQTIAPRVDTAQPWHSIELISAEELTPDGARTPGPSGLDSDSDEAAIGAADRFIALTISEKRVLEHVVSGNTNREIARRLFLSPHTVDSHLRHIFAKVGVSNRVQLSRAYYESAGAESTHSVGSRERVMRPSDVALDAGRGPVGPMYLQVHPNDEEGWL